MKTSPFLVLVPHRDARLPLRAWSASLFTAGLPGAWSFPWLVPLAELNRPLLKEELKSLARALRRHINENGGILTAGSSALSALDGYISVFGPALSLELPDDFFTIIDEAVTMRISPSIIGSALIPTPRSSLIPHLPPPPQVSFRAAALANMSYHFQDNDSAGNGYLSEWETGTPRWLPNIRV